MCKTRLIILYLVLLVSVPLSFSQSTVAIFKPVDVDNIGISTILQEMLSAEFSKSEQYIVVERANIDKVMAEFKFQLEGSVDESQLGVIGEYLGADLVCISSIVKRGESIVCNSKARTC